MCFQPARGSSCHSDGQSDCPLAPSEFVTSYISFLDARPLRPPLNDDDEGSSQVQPTIGPEQRKTKGRHFRTYFSSIIHTCSRRCNVIFAATILHLHSFFKLDSFLISSSCCFQNPLPGERLGDIERGHLVHINVHRLSREAEREGG